MLIHEFDQLHHYLVWQRSAICEDDAFLQVIPLINPASVSCDDLVEEDFVPICALLHCWEHFRSNLTILRAKVSSDPF